MHPSWYPHIADRLSDHGGVTTTGRIRLSGGRLNTQAAFVGICGDAVAVQRLRHLEPALHELDCNPLAGRDVLHELAHAERATAHIPDLQAGPTRCSLCKGGESEAEAALTRGVEPRRHVQRDDTALSCRHQVGSSNSCRQIKKMPRRQQTLREPASRCPSRAGEGGGACRQATARQCRRRTDSCYLQSAGNV